MCSLEDIASHMIPGDSEFGMPNGGGVDLRVLSIDAFKELWLQTSVKVIADYVHANSETNCSGLSSESFLEVIMAAPPPIRQTISQLGEWLLGAYFSDPVVQQSLGIASVPPFPGGTYIAPSNLESLEEVVNRGPNFRKVAQH